MDFINWVLSIWPIIFVLCSFGVLATTLIIRRGIS